MQIESRPLVLVTATTPDNVEHLVIVQNAETVKLVGRRAAAGTSSASNPAASSRESRSPGSGWWPTREPADSDDAAGKGWEAIPVTEVNPGDMLYSRLLQAARHAGMAVEEMCVEQ